jgi:hypothetical protein
VAVDAAALDAAPELPLTATTEQVRAAYARNQLLLLRQSPRAATVDAGVSLGALSEVYSQYTSAREQINRSWHVENGSPVRHSAANLLGSPASANRRATNRASAKDESDADSRWYVSFVLQADERLVGTVESKLGASRPMCLRNDTIDVTENLWCFFGQNRQAEPMRGRPEHCDDISHDGTWHVQLAGSKRWLVRPNRERAWPAHTTAPTLSELADRLVIDVREGDVLMINTKLWYHATEIPCTIGARADLSCSIARDFFLRTDGAALTGAVPVVQVASHSHACGAQLSVRWFASHGLACVGRWKTLMQRGRQTRSARGKQSPPSCPSRVCRCEQAPCLLCHSLLVVVSLPQA